jgi:hypothetical protein
MTRSVNLPRSKLAFRSQRAAESYIKELLKRLTADLTIRYNQGERDIDTFLDHTHQDFPTFVDLVERHHEWSRVAPSITAIRLSYRRSGGSVHYSRAQYFSFQSGVPSTLPEQAWIGFSYPACIRPFETNKRTLIAKEARLLVQSQIDDFRNQLRAEGRYACAFCGDSGSDVVIELDHVLPFSSIVRQFQKMGLNPLAHAEQWVRFHQHHAILRPLCQPCHAERTSGKPARARIEFDDEKIPEAN